MTTSAYAAQSATAPLAPFTIQRRGPGPHEVQIEILFCGVCHSDVHTVRDEWHGTTYPCVPGHEIIGRVTKVGAQVKKFKEGDLAGVGCMVDSCRVVLVWTIEGKRRALVAKLFEVVLAALAKGR